MCIYYKEYTYSNRLCNITYNNINPPGLFISLGVDWPPERSGRGAHLGLIVLVVGAILLLGGDAARGA